MVSVTYTHGYLNDFSVVGDYTDETLNNMIGADCTGSIDNGDYLMIEAKFDDGLDEWCYLTTVGGTDMEINTTLYPYWMCRYKCSANDVNAKVEIEYDGGGPATETLFTGTNSNVWTVASGTIVNAAAQGEIDHIRFYADDIDPALASTRYVYYDFILFCTGAFTFLNQAHGIDSDFPPKEAFLPIPVRDTDISQNLGTHNAVVNIGCNLDIGDWTRTGDNMDGDVFRDIYHNRSSEPWQWLDYDEGQMKATIYPRFSTMPSGGKLNRRVDLTCTEYSLGDKSAETYIERFGLNL